MHNTIIETFHFIPLIIIMMIFGAQFLWQTVKKQNLVIQQLDPLLLILSAIGTAAGANAHGHDISHLFDPCFGYAGVSLCVAARMLGFFKKVKAIKA
jgi:hypothetical protein